MSFRILLPGALAIGMVCLVGTQANGFDLLDGLLSANNYGGGKEVCCDGKATCASTCCAQKGFVQKGFVQKGCTQKGCAQKGCVQKGCVQKGCVQKGCVQKGCVQKGCAPRPCLLQEARCRIRLAAAELQCKTQALHCKTQALCDEIKVRLFCPRCCCQTKCGCGPEQSCHDIPMQKDLEVRK